MSQAIKRFAVGKPHVVALFDGAGVHFFDHNRNGIRQLGHISIPDLPTRRIDTQSEVLVRKVVDSRKPIVLRLAEDMGLVCYERFPATARSDLRAIVAHALDSITPWSGDKVVFDAKAIAESGEGQIEVQIIAAPVEQVEAGIDGLRKLGLTATAADIVVDFPNSPCTMNFWGGTEKPVGIAAPAWIAGFMAMIAFSTLAFVHQGTKLADDRRLEREAFAAALRSRLDDLPELRQQLDGLKSQSGQIAERRRNQPSVLLAIDQLSDALPDGVWLQRLSISGRELSMAGYAPDAETLLAIIEGHQAFTEAQFTSASRPEDIEYNGQWYSADSFSLSAAIESPGTELPPKARDRTQ